MPEPPPPDLAARQRPVVFATLLVAYASFYLCRSNVDAAQPLLQEAYGWTRSQVGLISTVGIATYAVGKLVLGALGDQIGGKRLMLLAMAGSVVATAAIGFTDGLPAIVAAAAVNRFFQSGGWAGLVHVASRWFPAATRGRVMGGLSTSYELGNVAALLFCGALVASGLGWRALFRFNPAIFAAVAVFVAFVLKAAPSGPAESDTSSPASASASASATAPTLREVLPWLARKPAFWGAVLLSALLTFIRTGFLTWTPTYLAEVARAAGSATAISGGIAKSAIFPASGVIAALTVGRLTDALGPGRRTPVMVVSLAVHVVAVLALAHTHVASPVTAALMIGVCGLFLLGPYSLPAGAMTLDVAGTRAASLTAGIVDGAGYICGSLSGVLLGGAADKWGWSAAFDVVACAATLALVVSALWWAASARSARRAE